jgi:hypothetical protein
MAQTVQDFTQIYDSYLAAVRSGNFTTVSAFFSKELRSQLTSPEDQKEYMMMANYMAPVSYETLFLTATAGGQKAELQVITTIKIPDDMQKARNLPPTQRLELILGFVKEAGNWKWDGPTILGDPDKRARPKDLQMGSRGDYKEGTSTQMGGQVLRVEKQSAGTVLVIRVLDEEIAAFLPASIVNAQFAPGRILVLRGAEHKSDKVKFWAEEAALHQR